MESIRNDSGHVSPPPTRHVPAMKRELEEPEAEEDAAAKRAATGEGEQPAPVAPLDADALAQAAAAAAAAVTAAAATQVAAPEAPPVTAPPVLTSAGGEGSTGQTTLEGILAANPALVDGPASMLGEDPASR